MSNIMTPKKLLKKLLGGYVGSRFIVTDIIEELIDNKKRQYIVVYDSASNNVKKVELTKDMEIPITQILEDVEDIMFNGYGNRHYAMISIDRNEIANIYMCRFLECTKYFAEEKKAGLLDDIATIDEKQKTEEQAEIIDEYLIDRGLANTIAEIETQLVKIAFSEPFSSLVETAEILHIIANELKYMSHKISRKLILVKAKKMAAYMVKHRLIELDPIAFMNDNSALYLIPKNAYLLGEYTAMAIVINTEHTPKTDIHKITMHQVLEGIAKRRLG